MSLEPPLSESLRLLREHEETPESPSDVAGRRRKVVAHLEQLARHRGDSARARRAWQRWGGAVAAAAILIWGGSWVARGGLAGAPRPESVAEVVTRSGIVELVRPGATGEWQGGSLAALDEIQTREASSAELRTAGGTEVSMEASSKVRFLPSEASVPNERVEIVHGAAEFSVPKLTHRQAFSVVTPDATVLVHGTRFAVAVVAGTGALRPETRVTVTEGLVEVRHLGEVRMLSAGATWTSDTTMSGTVKQEEDTARVPDGTQSTDQKRPAAAPPSRPSRLGEVNEHYGMAMAAKAAGNDARVVELLDLLLKQYPDSALAPNARVERLRAFQRLGKSDAAARSAREHLERNRDGFAREEAEAARKPEKRR